MELKGKNVAFLGDSITEGVGVSNRARNRYDNILKRECELGATYNYGVSGTRLAHQSVPSENPRHDLCFCGRAYDMTTAADVVVVYGGINDYIHGDAPVGQIGDRTPATFCGGVRFLMNLLRDKYPNKPIVFMTPARCCFGNGIVYTEPSNHPNKKADAMPVLGYVEIIQRTAPEFGIHVLDLYHELPIDPLDAEMHAKYTADGLHFNDEGQKILANCLKEFLEKLEA